MPRTLLRRGARGTRRQRNRSFTVSSAPRPWGRRISPRSPACTPGSTCCRRARCRCSRRGRGACTAKAARPRLPRTQPGRWRTCVCVCVCILGGGDKIASATLQTHSSSSLSPQLLCCSFVMYSIDTAKERPYDSLFVRVLVASGSVLHRPH